MASSRSTNTMGEFLSRMLGDLAQAKTLPDADLEFLIGMETQIIGKIREPIDTLQKMGQPPGLGPMPAGIQMGGGGGAPSGMGMPPAATLPGAGGPPMGVPGGPPGGLRQQPELPPVDEMQRMLATGS